MRFGYIARNWSFAIVLGYKFDIKKLFCIGVHFANFAKEVRRNFEEGVKFRR